MRNLGVAAMAASVLTVGLYAAVPPARTPAPQRAPATKPKPAAAHGPALMTAAAENTLVASNCATCHDDEAKTGGMSLEHFDAARIEQNADLAERMIKKLRAGMMPPPTVKDRPAPETLAAFATTLETTIDRAAALHPNPGRRPFQRLNRAEYARAVHDLLGIDPDVNAFLPPDTISKGFDNVADVQAMSPTLMEGYLRAASQISRLAVGDRSASATSATYKLGRNMSQMRHVDGAPMGTRGGISVVHIFPADGDYVFKVSLHYEPLGGLYGRTTMSTFDLHEQIEVSINGERVAVLPLNTRMSETDPKNTLEPQTPPIHVSAGPQRVSAAFIDNAEAPIDDLLVPLENTLADVSISYGVTALPHMRDFSIIGPSKVTGVSDTPSRRRIFSCRPTGPNDEDACATAILRRLTLQAYRGTANETDLRDAMSFYRQGRKKGDFESGIRLAVQAILASPQFIFRLESEPSIRNAKTYRVADDDLASRLSFFLWGSMPDAELVKAARQGLLSTVWGLDRQAKRMLKDPRAESLSTRFASQWLRLQDLEKIHPDYLLYPQYDDTLANAMKRETELFFNSIVTEDRSVLDLLTADYSFVNERLAKHYGIPNVEGAAFQRVTLPPVRRGLLGQGSILTLTSVADRTSPVQRGKWVMEVLLGTPPPPPPPNVPLLDETSAVANGHPLSTRERMEEHRKNPACSSCHRVIDPLGLALDNFDVTGAWRIKDNEVPIDSGGELYDGTKISGPAGLRDALLKHSDMVLRSFTESLMTYALGRRVEYYDMPTVRAIIRDAAKNDHRISSYILGVVNSPAFRMEVADDTLNTDVADNSAGRSAKTADGRNPR
jgi:cytochrome c551/c552